MSVRVTIGALCALVILSSSARAATDPERQWVTLRSPHFAVHTYDGGEDLARQVAAYAEEAWETLNPVLGWEPSETVHIRLIDDADASNGLASVLPYPVITLWAHPPPMDSDLADHDNWMRLLILHEYAHIAHLDHATGIPGVLNQVFGKVIKPNGALPRWLTEGIATWAESRHGRRGRLDSSRYRMMLRMAVLKDHVPSLAELTGKPLSPPRGDAWYLYGGHLVDQMVREAGPAALRAFIDAYGRRLVAYGMNIISRQSTGADLVQWHERMLRDVRQRAQETRESVLAEGMVQGEPLTHDGEGRRWPRFTPDGHHVVYVRSDGHSASRLVRHDVVPGGAEETIAPCDGGCGRFELSPRGDHLLATMGRPYRKVNHYRELIRVPLQVNQPRGAGEQITHGGRVEAPALAEDQDEVWVVRNRWGRTWLESLDVMTGETRRRWDPPEDARIDGPVPHRDGRVFLSMHLDGNRDLVELNPATGVWRWLTSGASLEIDPTLSPDGRWLVYTSDTTGIYNLYARDLTDPDGSTFRLTNVLGGAFSPAISPDGHSVVYVGWASRGEDLYVLPFDPKSGVSVSKADSQPRRSPSAVRPVSGMVLGEYESLPTLLPRSWAPSLVASSQGLSTVGLSLTGLDASRRVATALAAEWSAVHRSLAARADLDLGTSWSDLRWSAGRYVSNQPQLAGDRVTLIPQEVLFTTLGVSTRFPAPVTTSRIGASVIASLHRDVGGPLHPVHAPDAAEAVIPADGLRTSLKFSWSFNDVRRHPYSISVADGVSGGLSLRLTSPQPAQARLLTHQLRYHLRAYGAVPWWDDHVVALIVRGGWSGGGDATDEPFRLGDTPTQDLVSTLMQEVQTGSHWLRGYPGNTLTGSSFHLLTTEYRLPLGRIRRGLETLPIFARDLSMAVFHDLGLAYTEPMDPALLEAQARGSVGAEVRLTTDLFFALPLRLRFGWAWGWGPGGGHQGYLVLASDP